METLFSTETVASLSGTSIRQIGYWASTGLLPPSGRQARGKGTRRRFTFRDIVAARTVAGLREGGCPLQKIRVAIRHLRKHYPEETDGEMLAHLTLLTDGRSVYLEEDGERIREVVSQQFVWAVPLGLYIRETRARVAELPQDWIEPVKVGRGRYHLRVSRDLESGGYGVQCQELPGAIEQGETREEAIENGKAAIASVQAFLKRHPTRRGRGKLAASR